MKLAIISDTHGLLRPEVIEHIEGVDVILHGGDINKQSVVDELRRYAPLYVVRGNNDKDWAADIPHELTVTLGGAVSYTHLPALAYLHRDGHGHGPGHGGDYLRRQLRRAHEGRDVYKRQSRRTASSAMSRCPRSMRRR